MRSKNYDRAMDPLAVRPEPLVVTQDYFASGVRGQETVRLNLEFGGVRCTAEEDMARQEYALSTEIGYQISRFGVGHPVTFGEQDFDRMDLTTSMEIIEESSQRWLSLPKVVRDRYQSWTAVERAAKSGELEQLLRTAGAPAGRSGGAQAVPPSDSAAERPPKGAEGS